MVVALSVIITLQLLLIGAAGYLAYHLYTTGFLDPSNLEKFPLAPTPKTFPTVSLLLMGPGDITRHEVSLHVAKAPFRYIYAGIIYQYVDTTADGVLRYRER